MKTLLERLVAATVEALQESDPKIVVAIADRRIEITWDDNNTPLNT